MAASPFVVPYQSIPFASTQIYQPNGRLVDLIRLQGEQSAEGQRRAGEIQAQMWGNLGNQITQGVGSVLKAQQDAPINALNQQKVKDALDLRAGQAVVDKALQPSTPVGPQEEGAPPAVPQHPYLSDDGLVDPTKVTALLNANGMGHLAPELLKPIETQNASIAAYKDHQTETATKQAVVLGSVANTTIALMKTGVPFQDAAGHASSSLVASGVLPPDVVQGQIQRLAALPPDQQLAALQQLKATAARLGPTKTLSDGAKEVDMFGDTVANNPKEEKPKTRAELAADAANPTSPTHTQSAEALLLDKPEEPKPPRPLDQQLLDAVTKGDAAAHDRIIKTMRDEAQAKGDPAAIAATERQIKTVEANTAQQSRAQDFQTKKQAREDIDKINKDFLTARTSADTLRDVVASAQSGNKVAGSLQSLEATMAAIRAQGLNRINSSEIGVTADAGNAWDRIVGWFGKKSEGQPVPKNIQEDMKTFADILDKAAYKKYGDAHDATNTLYGTTIPRTFSQPQSTTPASPALTPGLQGLANR